MRLLLVEDTADVAGAILAHLGRGGFACDHAPTLALARDHVAVQAYAAIILDIHLPDGDGRRWLGDLRRAGQGVPVLMLTAEFDVAVRIDALDGGADDYLVKPFDLRELEARLRVLLRRQAGAVPGRAVTLGGLVYDRAAQTVRIGGRPVALTRRELALLRLMLDHPGQVMAKQRLFEGLFRFDEAEVGENAIELYVARLRKKLAGSGVAIQTLRGLGYRLVGPDG